VQRLQDAGAQILGLLEGGGELGHKDVLEVSQEHLLLLLLWTQQAPTPNLKHASNNPTSKHCHRIKD